MEEVRWDKTKTDYLPKKKGMFKDLTDIKHNRLTPKYPIKKPNNKNIYWYCECECGGTCVVVSGHLGSGAIRSCGCLSKEAHVELTKRKFKGICDLSCTFFTQIFRGAKKRNLEFTITKEYIWDLFISQNKKCALSGVDIDLHPLRNTSIQTASLDRIDSSLGYIEGNVQWVHKNLNIMKSNLPLDDFINWCNLVVQHNKENFNADSIFNPRNSRIRENYFRKNTPLLYG